MLRLNWEWIISLAKTAARDIKKLGDKTACPPMSWDRLGLLDQGTHYSYVDRLEMDYKKNSAFSYFP